MPAAIPGTQYYAIPETPNSGDTILNSGSAPDMLGQARAVFALCEGLDLSYMQRRISEETGGDYGLQDLQDQA